MSEPTRLEAWKADPYLERCVLCHRTTEPFQDFCAECREAGAHEDNFGRCYVCRDFHDHQGCIGVPCQCDCPPPDLQALEVAKQELLKQLALTPEQIRILGL